MLLSHSENSGISNTSPRKRLMASPGESGQRRRAGTSENVFQQVFPQQRHGVDKERHIRSEDAVYADDAPDLGGKQQGYDGPYPQADLRVSCKQVEELAHEQSWHLPEQQDDEQGAQIA